MITFEQLREAVFNYEASYIHSMMEDEGQDSTEQIKEMEEQIMNAEHVEEIVNYYTDHGYEEYEGYENILKALMAKTTIVH